MTPSAERTGGRARATPLQRRVLAVAILASFIAVLDGFVVNLALPALGRELGGGLSAQQWVVDAYLLTLGAFILLAGAVSDIVGRGRIMQLGLWGFGITSLLCALAPAPELLIVGRALQGVCGAMLVPSSLSLIMAHFDGVEQSAAIGTWTASTGAASIVAPLIGGLAVDLIGWRVIFLVNIAPIAVCLALLPALMHSDTRRPGARIDALGGALTVVGLGGLVFALIEAGRLSWTHPLVLGPATLGVGALIGLVLHERRAPAPMVPPALLVVRNVAWGNAATFAIYGALGLSSLVLTLYLQQVAGFSATVAGLATLPTTVLMIVFSAPVGRLAGRWGARWFMTLGPLLAASGHLLLLRVGPEPTYATDLLPGILLFGIGLTTTVAPLTAAILGAVPRQIAGVGSAINNAVARVAGLVTTAAAGLVIGGALDTAALHRVLIVCAVLFTTGAVLSLAGIRTPAPIAGGAAAPPGPSAGSGAAAADPPGAAGSAPDIMDR